METFDSCTKESYKLFKSNYKEPKKDTNKNSQTNQQNANNSIENQFCLKYLKRMKKFVESVQVVQQIIEILDEHDAKNLTAERLSEIEFNDSEFIGKEMAQKIIDKMKKGFEGKKVNLDENNFLVDQNKNYIIYDNQLSTLGSSEFTIDKRSCLCCRSQIQKTIKLSKDGVMKLFKKNNKQEEEEKEEVQNCIINLLFD